jgi:hypothetical protein
MRYCIRRSPRPVATGHAELARHAVGLAPSAVLHSAGQTAYHRVNEERSATCNVVELAPTMPIRCISGSCWATGGIRRHAANQLPYR